jgi:hypothetical protein
MADEDYSPRQMSWCPECVMLREEPETEECPNCTSAELLAGMWVYECTHCQRAYLEVSDAENCCG